MHAHRSRLLDLAFSWWCRWYCLYLCQTVVHEHDSEFSAVTSTGCGEECSSKHWWCGKAAGWQHGSAVIRSRCGVSCLRTSLKNTCISLCQRFILWKCVLKPWYALLEKGLFDSCISVIMFKCTMFNWKLGLDSCPNGLRCFTAATASVKCVPTELVFIYKGTPYNWHWVLGWMTLQ